MESESELQVACRENNITATSHHVGLVLPKWLKEARRAKSHIDYMDQWEVILSYQNKTYTLDYFTGLGQRVPAPLVRMSPTTTGTRYVFDTHSGNRCLTLTEASMDGLLVLKKQRGVIVGPDVADVLSSLFSGSCAGEMTFRTWCSEFGYNPEERRPLDLYLEFQDSYDELVRLLGYELFHELREKEH